MLSFVRLVTVRTALDGKFYEEVQGVQRRNGKRISRVPQARNNPMIEQNKVGVWVQGEQGGPRQEKTLMSPTYFEGRLGG